MRSGRSSFRVLGWMVVASGIPALGGCTSRPLEQPGGTPAATFTMRFLQGIAAKLAVLLQPPCVVGQIAAKPNTASPDCTVVTHTRSKGTTINEPIPACAETGVAGPCWSLVSGVGTCVGQTVRLTPGPVNPLAQGATVTCALCVPGVSAPGRGCP